MTTLIISTVVFVLLGLVLYSIIQVWISTSNNPDEL
ncbi:MULTISPECIES: YnaM/YnfT family protein [Klebsiella pneumoniae complex]